MVLPLEGKVCRWRLTPSSAVSSTLVVCDKCREWERQTVRVMSYMEVTHFHWRSSCEKCSKRWLIRGIVDMYLQLSHLRKSCVWNFDDKINAAKNRCLDCRKISKEKRQKKKRGGSYCASKKYPWEMTKIPDPHGCKVLSSLRFIYCAPSHNDSSGVKNKHESLIEIGRCQMNLRVFLENFNGISLIVLLELFGVVSTTHVWYHYLNYAKLFKNSATV